MSTVFHKETGKICISEQKAIEKLMASLEELGSKTGLLMYDLDVLMPTLKEKLHKYGFFKQFNKCIKYVCDLKSIVISKDETKHFKTFCWGKSNLIFNHVFKKDFPVDIKEYSTKISCKNLWLCLEKMFKCDDIQKCHEFANYFYPSKVLLKSNLPMSTSTTRLSMYKQISYQSSIFKHPLKL